MTDIHPCSSGPVSGIDRLVVSEYFGRARNLLLYRAEYRGDQAIVAEYAPFALVDRKVDGSLEAEAGCAGVIRHHAVAWSGADDLRTCWTNPLADFEPVSWATVLRQDDASQPWAVVSIGNLPFLSLEAWVRGGSLARPLGPVAAAGLARALARGMSVAHPRSDFNLNICPASIFQFAPANQTAQTLALAPVPDDRVLIAVAGTNGSAAAPYAPIELADGAMRFALGAWSDIYSASAALAYAITGQHPPDWRDARDPGAWLRNHSAAARHPAPFLSGIAAGLAVQPRDRPQTVELWLAALGIDPTPGDATWSLAPGWEWAAAPTIAPPHVDVPEPPPPRGNGAHVLTGALAGLVLALLGLVGVLALGERGLIRNDSFAFAGWGGWMAAVALFAHLGTKGAALVQTRRFRQGITGIALASAVALMLIAVSQWPDSSPVIEEGLQPEDPPEGPEVPTAPDLSPLGIPTVFQLSGGRWVDVGIFDGQYRPAGGICAASGAGALTIVMNYDGSVEPSGGRTVGSITTPGGIIYYLELADAVSGRESPDRSAAAVSTLGLWRDGTNQTVEFVINDVQSTDQSAINPVQPDRARLNRLTGGGIAFSTRYSEGDGPESSAGFEVCEPVPVVEEMKK